MRPAGSRVRVVALRALCECRGLPQSCVPPSLLSIKSSEYIKKTSERRVAMAARLAAGLSAGAAPGRAIVARA
jgi:hypothetical protein